MTANEVWGDLVANDVCEDFNASEVCGDLTAREVGGKLGNEVPVTGRSTGIVFTPCETGRIETPPVVLLGSAVLGWIKWFVPRTSDKNTARAL